MEMCSFGMENEGVRMYRCTCRFGVEMWWYGEWRCGVEMWSGDVEVWGEMWKCGGRGEVWCTHGGVHVAVWRYGVEMWSGDVEVWCGGVVWRCGGVVWRCGGVGEMGG